MNSPVNTVAMKWAFEDQVKQNTQIDLLLFIFSFQSASVCSDVSPRRCK